MHTCTHTRTIACVPRENAPFPKTLHPGSPVALTSPPRGPHPARQPGPRSPITAQQACSSSFLRAQPTSVHVGREALSWERSVGAEEKFPRPPICGCPTAASTLPSQLETRPGPWGGRAPRCQAHSALHQEKRSGGTERNDCKALRPWGTDEPGLPGVRVPALSFMPMQKGRCGGFHAAVWANQTPEPQAECRGPGRHRAEARSRGPSLGWNQEPRGRSSQTFCAPRSGQGRAQDRRREGARGREQSAREAGPWLPRDSADRVPAVSQLLLLPVC